MERTFVLLKPDGVFYASEILQLIESNKLKIIASTGKKTISRKLADRHFPKEEYWLNSLGNKTLKGGKSVVETFGTDDPLEIGREIRNWGIEYLCSGPVIGFAVEGENAVFRMRQLAGDTLPSRANPGTIRYIFGNHNLDFSWANKNKKALPNSIHVSDSPPEAERELRVWFGGEDLL